MKTFKMQSDGRPGSMHKTMQEMSTDMRPTAVNSFVGSKTRTLKSTAKAINIDGVLSDKTSEKQKLALKKESTSKVLVGRLQGSMMNISDQKSNSGTNDDRDSVFAANLGGTRGRADRQRLKTA